MFYTYIVPSSFSFVVKISKGHNERFVIGFLFSLFLFVIGKKEGVSMDDKFDISGIYSKITKP